MMLETFGGQEALLVVASLISPLLTSIFLKTNMSSQTKSIIFGVVSAAIGLVYVFLHGGFDDITGAQDLLFPIGAAYGIGNFMYSIFLKKPATYIEANFGLKTIDLGKPEGEKAEVLKGTTVDGSEVVVAVPEDKAEQLVADGVVKPEGAEPKG